MQVQKIYSNNYNAQFNGTLKIQNFVTGETIEKVLPEQIDEILAGGARELFDLPEGKIVDGLKKISREKLVKFLEKIKEQTDIETSTLPIFDGNEDFLNCLYWWDMPKLRLYHIEDSGKFNICHER